MKLTIKNIIRWEQLQGKSFSALDITSNNDIVSLIYATSDTTTTLEEFTKTFTDEDAATAIQELESELLITSQFQATEKTEKQTSKSENTPKSKPSFIKDIAASLIMNGLDASFVMHEMAMHDLPLFINAQESITRRKMEDARLWTFLVLTPHLSRKSKRPIDILTFPWESEEKEKETQRNIEKGKQNFTSFMGIKNTINE